jgi:hypothetical protein
MVALPLLALALAPLHALALPRGNVNAGAVGQVPFVPKLGSGSGLSDIDADSSNNNNLVMNSSTPAFASESASEGNLAERYDGHEVWRIDTSRVPAHLREWLIEMMDVSVV